MFVIPEYIYIDFWILSFLSGFLSDPVSTGHLSSLIQAVVEIFCIILWITIHEICVSHLMFSPGLYSSGECRHTFLIVMIFLFTLYRFNEVENRNGYPQADEHSKTAFSVVE